MGKVGKTFLKKILFGHFSPFLKKNFFLEKLGSVSLDFTIIYHYAKNQRKLTNGYPENSKLTVDIDR